MIGRDLRTLREACGVTMGEHAAAALDRERRMLLALGPVSSAEAFDAPSGAPCLRCGGAYAVACPLCSLAGDR